MLNAFCALSIICFITLSGLPVWAGKETFKDTTPVVNTSRFPIANDFRGTHSVSHTLQPDGRYMPDKGSYTHQINFRMCETFLVEALEYGLNKRVREGRAEAELVQKALEEATKQNPQQVTLFTKTRLSDTEIEVSNDDPSLTDRPTKTHVVSSYEQNEYFTGTIWTVAAQVWNTINHKLDFSVKMPWQSMPVVDQLPPPDRSKYKYAAEVGHADQEFAGEINPLYNAAGGSFYSEVKALGGKLNEAYLFVLGVRRGNVKLYKDWFGAETSYPEGRDVEKNNVQAVPLAQWLNRYPPSQYFSRLAQLKALSGNSLTETETMDLLMELKMLRWQELDVKLPGQGLSSQPLVVQDLSHGRFYRMIDLLRKYKFNDEQIKKTIEELAGPLQQTLIGLGRDVYKDTPDTYITHFYHLRNNSIEVSNLDSAYEKNPEYVLKILFGVAEYYARTTALNMKPQADTLEVLRQLAERGIHISIDTMNPVMAAMIQFYFKPEKTFKQDPQPDISPGETAFYGYDKTVHSFSFSMSQILYLMEQKPNLAAQALGSVQKGSWQKAYNLSDPDIF